MSSLNLRKSELLPATDIWDMLATSDWPLTGTGGTDNVCGYCHLAGCVVGIGGVAAYFYALYQTTGAFFEVNGVRLHYVEAGQGTPVILVHGLAFNLAFEWMFPRVFQKLSKRYRVIAMDNRGHGKSDKPYDPAQYGLEMVEDVVRLMDHLGIAKAHVVGYSLGGFITLKLALTHPDRLLSAVPCGAGWTPNPMKNSSCYTTLRRTLNKGAVLRALLKWLQPPEKPLPAPGAVVRQFPGVCFKRHEGAVVPDAQASGSRGDRKRGAWQCSSVPGHRGGK